MIRTRLRDRGGNGLFLPTSISGLKLWLDASDASTITQSGGSVSQWNDKSGNANHATQATGANQPLTGTDTVNGKNAITFNGTSAFMMLTNAISSGNKTIFFVMRGDSTASTVTLIGSDAPSGTNTTGYLYLTQSGSANTEYYRGFSSLSTYKNGTLQAYTTRGGAFTGLYNDTANIVTSVGVASISVFKYICGGAFSYYHKGLGLEVIAYDSILSTTQLNKVGQYLSSKWGITWVTI